MAGIGAVDDLHRLAAHAAHDLVLAHPVGHLARGHEESHGIPAADHGDRHRRAARFVLVAHLAAVLARRDVEARGLGVVDHHAIGAAVDPALVGIAGDVEAAGADVAAAVGRVPFGRGEGGDVDVVSGHDVLENRTVSDVFGRDARHRAHEIGAEPFAQLDLAEIGGEPERHVLALAAEEVDQHPAAFDRPRNLVEHEAGRAVVVNHAGDHADILLPGEPAHVLDLAELARLLEPLTQIVVAKPWLEIRASRGIGGFRRAGRTVHGIGLCGHSRPPGGGELTCGVAGAHPANFRSAVRRSVCGNDRAIFGSCQLVFPMCRPRA